MKKLFPSFAPPQKWRNESQSRRLEGIEWQRLRKEILARDDFTCAYCSYRSEKFQIIDHIDGDPENNDYSNFQVVCQTCNLIKHAGQGCVVKGIVDLYEHSSYSQNDVMIFTRKLRDEGKTDDEIIEFLGLKGKAPFKQDLNYLKNLYGFVSSRRSGANDDMYDRWLEYHKMQSHWKGGLIKFINSK